MKLNHFPFFRFRDGLMTERVTTYNTGRCPIKIFSQSQGYGFSLCARVTPADSRVLLDVDPRSGATVVAAGAGWLEAIPATISSSEARSRGETIIPGSSERRQTPGAGTSREARNETHAFIGTITDARTCV